MAWHSKRHNIKHKKAATDAKKAKVYTKIAKLITISAKNWPDPSMNPALDLALKKAKYNSVPKDIIEKAIKKWSWQNDWNNFTEILYEWYWPWWTAILVKALTDNTNRTNTNLKVIFQKWWWNIAERWAVSRQFKEKWVIIIDWNSEIINEKWKEIEKITKLNKSEFEDFIFQYNIDDIDYDNNETIITTSKESFHTIQQEIEKKYHIKEASLQFIPDNILNVNEDNFKKCEILIEKLEEDDDVDEVWINI